MTARPPARSRGSLATVAVGLAIAGPALAATFRGPKERFWSRMRIGPREVTLGLASASALYATFSLGDRFARRFVPGGDRQIRDIYSLRELAPRSETALRLCAIVAPAEELFWRGLVQETLMRRHGRWRGAALATLAYSAAHVSSGNFTLLGAAGVAGAHWSILYAAGVPIGALVVSHCAWDVWIFLVRPTGEVAVVGDAANRAVSLGRLLSPAPCSGRPPTLISSPV